VYQTNKEKKRKIYTLTPKGTVALWGAKVILGKYLQSQFLYSFFDTLEGIRLH